MLISPFPLDIPCIWSKFNLFKEVSNTVTGHHSESITTIVFCLFCTLNYFISIKPHIHQHLQRRTKPPLCYNDKMYTLSHLHTNMVPYVVEIYISVIAMFDWTSQSYFISGCHTSQKQKKYIAWTCAALAINNRINKFQLDMNSYMVHLATGPHGLPKYK